MTFDSLGGSHAAVGRKLAKWLEWEAQEKRNVQHRLSPAQYHDAKGVGAAWYCVGDTDFDVEFTAVQFL
jgi:hypothetical protein